MGKVHYECERWDCDGVETDEGDPAPINCGCGGRIIPGSARLTEEEEDDGGAFPSPTAKGSPRPSWYPGRRKEVKGRATSPGGRVYCQICGSAIALDRRGKEVWTSKGGKTHVTSPHVDHHAAKGGGSLPTSATGGVQGVKGDWAERKATLRASALHMAKSTPDREEVEREVFNASPLRTSHMRCNCGRPKYNSRYHPYK